MDVEGGYINVVYCRTSSFKFDHLSINALIHTQCSVSHAYITELFM